MKKYYALDLGYAGGQTEGYHQIDGQTNMLTDPGPTDSDEVEEDTDEDLDDVSVTDDETTGADLGEDELGDLDDDDEDELDDDDDLEEDEEVTEPTEVSEMDESEVEEWEEDIDDTDDGSNPDPDEDSDMAK